MTAIWILVAIFGIIAILLCIAVYFSYIRRRTTIGMLRKKVWHLQDVDVAREEELELRKQVKRFKGSIEDKEKKIGELVDKDQS